MKLWIALFVGLVLADSATKLYNHTPDWGWHEVPTPGALKWAGVVGMALMALWHVTRLPAVLALAGAVGNSLWTYNPRGVANPFVAEAEGGFDMADSYLLIPGTYGPLAYNFADVCLVFAVPTLLICTSVWIVGLLTCEGAETSRRSSS